MKQFCLLTLLLSFSFTITAQEKPNILWITLEDTSPHFIGCYGNKDAKTPVIDKLASEGIRFQNAFSTGTVCSPSRTAIITGVKTYKTGTGNHRSAVPIPSYIKGFPYYLQEEGYHTSNNSKTDYNVADEKAYTAESWNESSKQAGWWNRKNNQPFFSVFNYMDSHQSRTMTHTYGWYKKQVLDKLSPSEQIGESDFEMPPFYKDSPAMRKQVARVYNSLKYTDKKVGALLKRLEEDGLKENTIIFLYADHGEGIPRGKTNGINLGYRVPFIAYFPKKFEHLSPWGEPGSVSNELISFEDLAPTMIHLAGGKIPDHLTGRIIAGTKPSSRTDHLNLSSDRADNGIDMVRTVTDGTYVYSRNYIPYMPQARYIRYMEISDIKQIMRKDLAEENLNSLQKSLFTERPPEYLFNIHTDQWETINLAENPKYKNILKRMRTQLKEEIMDSRDILFLPEYEMNLISKHSTPFEYRTSKKYKLKEVQKAANLSGFRSEKTAKQQIQLLTSKNKVVRYWAIVGLRSQENRILNKYHSELLVALEDSYPPVAIMTAAILYNLEENKTALNSLKKFCLDPNEDLALMAVNSILYFSNKTPFIETVKNSRAMEHRTYNVKASCVDVLGSLGLIPNNPKFRQ